MYAKVTAYKGRILCQLLATASNDNVASSIDRPGNMGQVIMDTEKYLGVSDEAIELLKTVKNGRDAIGDVDWFKSSDGKMNFAWFGPVNRIINPDDAEAARGFRVPAEGNYIKIENEVPLAARSCIDAVAG